LNLISANINRNTEFCWSPNLSSNTLKFKTYVHQLIGNGINDDSRDEFKCQRFKICQQLINNNNDYSNNSEKYMESEYLIPSNYIFDKLIGLFNNDPDYTYNINIASKQNENVNWSKNKDENDFKFFREWILQFFLMLVLLCLTSMKKKILKDNHFIITSVMIPNNHFQ
jgi:hypothetical protein